MGLDMYLERVKKVPGTTVKELRNLEHYFTYKNRLSESSEEQKNAEGISFKEWAGIEENEVRKDLIDMYKPEYKTYYSDWDTEHLYPMRTIFEEVGYWRKANPIHKWFVDNVQNGVDDCGSYEVPRADLLLLLLTCNIVISKSELIPGQVTYGYTYDDGEFKANIKDGLVVKDPTVAMQLLPPTDGCFFGSTEIDQGYIEDLKYTAELIKTVLETTDPDNQMIVYSSSW